jgi:hypothetical protein
MKTGRIELKHITIVVILFGLMGMLAGCSSGSGRYSCAGVSSSAYTQCAVLRDKGTTHDIEVECLRNGVIGGRGWIDQVKNESGRTCVTEISIHHPDGTVDDYTKSGYFSPTYDGYSALGVNCPHYDDENPETCTRMCGTCSGGRWVLEEIGVKDKAGAS